jgi:hypothetical protein
LLLPVRTQLSAFHDEVAGFADIFFIRRRFRFVLPDTGGKTGLLPFASMFALYRGDELMVGRMLTNFDCVHVPKQAIAIGRRQNGLPSVSDISENETG